MSDESQGTQVFVTGRIVHTGGGDLFKGKPQFDEQTRQPVIDQRTGLQKIQYGFGIAVSKQDLQDALKGAIYQAIYKEAYQLYPSRQLPPDFALKFKDGDGVDHLGASFATREGYAGCLVFNLFTQLPIQYVRWNPQTQKNEQMTDGIKCGDYVQACVQVKAHSPKGRGKAGVYLNPTFVQFLGWGPEIINRPTGDAIFGNQAPQLPPGASATPLAPPQSFQGMPGQPGAPAPAHAPNFNVLPQQHQQQFAPQQPPAAPMAPPAQQQWQQPMQPGAPAPQQWQQPQGPAAPPAQQWQQPMQPGMPAPGPQAAPPQQWAPQQPPAQGAPQYPPQGNGFPPIR